MLELLAQRQLAAGGRAQARRHLGGKQRLPAQGEEVVVGADGRDPQDLLPDAGDQLLQAGPRRGEGGAVAVRAGRRAGQRLAVQLAAGGERQGGQRHHLRRDHGGGQARQQPRAQRAGVDRRGAGGGHHERHQAARLAARRDRCRAHRRMARQRGFDLGGLDAYAADLELEIAASQVVDRAVRQVPRQVAGAVEPGAAAGEGVGHELFGGQVGPAQIAAGELHAADVELARHARRHLAPGLVEQVDAGVGDRPADRHQPTRARRVAGPGGDFDRGLGRAVEVVQRRAHRGVEALLQVVGQRFAARQHAAQVAPARPCRRRRRRQGLHRGKERTQHRRHEVDDGDVEPGQGVDQVGVVQVAAGAGHDQLGAGRERPEQLPHRNVEPHRRLLQHPVGRRCRHARRGCG